MGINLLTSKYKRELLFSKRKWIKTGIILLLLGVILGISLNYYSYRIHLLKTEKIFEDQLAALKPSLDKYTEHEKTLIEKEKTEEVVNKIYTEKLDWSRLLKDLSGCLVNGSWFTQIDKEKNKFIIHGNAESFTAVSAYATELRSLEWFENVDLLVAQKLINDSEEGARIHKVTEEEAQDFFSFKSDQPLFADDMIKFTIEAELKDNLSLLDSSQGGSK